MQIDIFADPICPWCYIGKRRLERALAARQLRNARLRWRVFRLNPDFPAEGLPREIYLRRKFGGVLRARKLFENIRRVGLSEGIEFDFDGISRVPDTTRAHRLLQLATGTPAATELMETLFRRYLVEASGIDRIEDLVEMAARAGLDRARVTDYLRGAAGDGSADDIDTEDQAARRLGIRDVPFFIVNNQYALSGAQEPEAFYPLFEMTSSTLVDA